MDAPSLARAIDEEACRDTLAEMVRHKSHSETKSERVLALRMVGIMSEMGIEAHLQPVERELPCPLAHQAGRCPRPPY